jgi:hypothetical protein
MWGREHLFVHPVIPEKEEEPPVSTGRLFL